MAQIPMAYEHQSEKLLLSDQEAAWKQEMAVEGAAHLPISWYRQSPRSLVTSAYGIINLVLAGVFNFGINVGIGYLVLKGNDVVGLWQSPNAGDHPYKSAAVGDLLLTTAFVAFLSCLLGSPGIRRALKKGETVPVEANLMHGGLLTCTPVRMMGTCTKSALLTIWSLVFLAVPFLALLAGICAGGEMYGSGSQCYMSRNSYIYLKAVYAALVAMIINPIILLCALNSRTLPRLDLTLFLDHQKQKWDEQKRSEHLQPL